MLLSSTKMCLNILNHSWIIHCRHLFDLNLLHVENNPMCPANYFVKNINNFLNIFIKVMNICKIIRIFLIWPAIYLLAFIDYMLWSSTKMCLNILNQSWIIHCRHLFCLNLLHIGNNPIGPANYLLENINNYQIIFI